jgi:glyceraldehyde 3-phosphate dehydrogenase
MTVRVAINGYGRIGRAILRANYEIEESDRRLEIVAINDLCSTETNAHLTEYDSVHGRYSKKVRFLKNEMFVDDKKINMFSERNPENLPWGDLNVDVVLECTGLFTNAEKANSHLKAGAKKVLISAPGSDVDATVVFGVNNKILNSKHKIISNASCTTNCLAPLALCLNDNLGIESGLMTTIHSFTNDQLLVDSFHKDIRRARAATLSMIPTKTGAAAAVGLVLPELQGKLDGFSMRVPTVNVSVVDLTIITSRLTSVEEVNEIVSEASSQEQLQGILGISEKPLVSIDFNHDPRSSIFDSTQTRVSKSGNLVKVLSWYDNEWGFSNRMIDTARQLGEI